MKPSCSLVPKTERVDLVIHLAFRCNKAVCKDDNCVVNNPTFFGSCKVNALVPTCHKALHQG